MHAAALAAELEIPRIICPRASGVLSALGLIAAGRRRDTARTVLLSARGHDRRPAGRSGRRAGRGRPARAGGRGARGGLRAALPRAGLRAAHSRPDDAGPGRPRGGLRPRARVPLRLPGSRRASSSSSRSGSRRSCPGRCRAPARRRTGAWSEETPQRPIRRRVGRDPGRPRRAGGRLPRRGARACSSSRSRPWSSRRAGPHRWTRRGPSPRSTGVQRDEQRAAPGPRRAAGDGRARSTPPARRWARC